MSLRSLHFVLAHFSPPSNSNSEKGVKSSLVVSRVSLDSVSLRLTVFEESVHAVGNWMWTLSLWNHDSFIGRWFGKESWELSEVDGDGWKLWQSIWIHITFTYAALNSHATSVRHPPNIHTAHFVISKLLRTKKKFFYEGKWMCEEGNATAATTSGKHLFSQPHSLLFSSLLLRSMVYVRSAEENSSVLFLHSLARLYACCVGAEQESLWKIENSTWKLFVFIRCGSAECSCFFGSNALACSAVHFALIITFFSHFPHLFSLEHRREIYIHFDSHTHHSSPSCSAERALHDEWHQQTKLVKMLTRNFISTAPHSIASCLIFSEWAGDWVDEFSVDNHQNSCLNRKMFFLRNLFLKWHSMLLMLLWVSTLTFRHDRSASFQEVVIHLSSAVAITRLSAISTAQQCSLFDHFIWFKMCIKVKNAAKNCSME